MLREMCFLLCKYEHLAGCYEVLRDIRMTALSDGASCILTSLSTFWKNLLTFVSVSTVDTEAAEFL
jgi:hypothetical protein